MTLLACQIFSTIAHEGSFARTAEQLHLTPSAISHAVSTMEAECGFPLFTRTKSGVTMTAAAENLLPAIQRLLASSESLDQSIAQINGMHKGVLRLGVFNSACVTWLPQLVAVFMIALLLLCCAYVLPATSLSERWGFVLRLQMLMNISPSTLAWSLMLITELLLFLVAFAGSGSFLCACVKRAAKLRVPLLPFALLCVPLALIGADIAEKALMAVLPLRYPIAVLLVGMILIFNAFARKKEGKTA